MADDIVDLPALRWILPFEALPIEVRRLRRAIVGALGCRMPEGLLEEAQLVVSELATNVLQHVGEEASAALVLELRDTRLRVEVHDKSHSIPLVTRTECGEECGRGLHLIAALVEEWGTVLTAAGKIVWCELALPEGEFRAGARRAEEALQTYQARRGRPLLYEVKAPTGLTQPAVELIADLLHWAAARGCDPDDLLDQAVVRWEGEVA
ncbi:ATP-binding protein [Streptomyces fractus]|uniref:ATP-binding protein n=1 Tax=Streptomyces fractus TaxID=641806 RepID=UPI003CF7C2E7